MPHAHKLDVPLGARRASSLAEVAGLTGFAISSPQADACRSIANNQDRRQAVGHQRGPRRVSWSVTAGGQSEAHMSGAGPRRKGDRLERELVARHKALGVPAERYPLSGASQFRGSRHDVDIYALGQNEAPLAAEVKARAKAPALPRSKNGSALTTRFSFGATVLIRSSFFRGGCGPASSAGCSDDDENGDQAPGSDPARSTRHHLLCRCRRASGRIPARRARSPDRHRNSHSGAPLPAPDRDCLHSAAKGPGRRRGRRRTGNWD